MDIWVARRIARLRARQAGLRGARPVAASPIELGGMSPLAPVHPAVPEGRGRRLPRRRRRRLDAAEGGRAPAGARAGPAQAAHRAERHQPRRVAGRARAAARRPGGAPRRAAPRPGARSSATPARTACPMRSTCCSMPPRCCATSRSPSCSSATASRRPRLAQRVRDEGLANVALFDADSEGADPDAAGRDRHRLHRLAARADLPLRHRAEQADGLHDGRLRRAAFGGGRQRPGGRGGLRADGGAGVGGGRGRGPAPPRRDAAGRAPRDGRARPRLRARATTPIRCWRSASSRRCREARRAAQMPHPLGAGARGALGRHDVEREPDAVADATPARRGDRYSLLRPDVWQTVQERQRAMLRLFARVGPDRPGHAAPARSGLRRRRQPARTAATRLRARAPDRHRTAARALRAGAPGAARRR